VLKKTGVNKLNIAIFVSGTGRTLRNFLEYSKKNGTFNVCFVLANRDCLALEIAKESKMNWMLARDAHEKGWEIAEQNDVDIICLGGFQYKLNIPEHWTNRVVNGHPALIPSFCGKGYQVKRVHREVLESKVQVTGSTIHFCDNEYDHGPIICQRPVIVDPDWTWNDLSVKVFEQECIAYPHAVEAIRVYKEEYARNATVVDPDEVARIARGKYPLQAPLPGKSLTNPEDLVRVFENQEAL
jgi:phosphoribosylglycinamide formyltransferase-1